MQSYWSPKVASIFTYACTSTYFIQVYRDVHKKLTHFFYNFYRPKRRKAKDDFADTKR